MNFRDITEKACSRRMLHAVVFMSVFFAFVLHLPVARAQLNIADINRDGVVDLTDFSILASNFLQISTNPFNIADLNQDGVVDLSDFSVLANNFLQVAPPTSTDPTPPPGHGHTEGESMAMMAWGPDGANKPRPQYDRCDDGTDIVAAHNMYYVVAYDGVKYPTWHPPVVDNPITGVGKCYFGHEHGTNPQRYIHWNEIVQHFGKDLNGDGVITPMVISSTGQITEGDRAGLPFGIANEHMDLYYNQEGHDSVFVRHEDHVGHKVEIANYESDVNTNIDGHVTSSTHQMTQLAGTNGINVPYYTLGSNTFKHTGVSCTHLHKFHQGTHSGDAILNNLHEVIFHSKCQSVDVSGIDAPAYYPNNTVILTGMMAFGRPGIYKQFCFAKRDDNICGLTGENFGTSVSSSELERCKLTDPLLSRLPNAINSNSLGRNITDVACLENFDQINPGTTYFNPYELWEGDLAIYKGNTLTDSTLIAEHGRQWDVIDPVRVLDIGYRHPTRASQKDYQYTWELCNTLLRQPGTNIRRTLQCDNYNANIPWDSPQAAFRGLKRTTYFGTNRVSNQGGAQIWWTDPLGGNAVTTPFSSGLKQYVSPVHADIQRVQSRVQQLFGSDHFLNDRALQRQFSSGGGTVHAPN